MSPDQARFDELIRMSFEEHHEVMAAAAAELSDILERVVATAVRCVEYGGKVLVCGNGGSAADAQHLAAELVCRFRFNRRAVAAVALTTDTSALTAIANDFGYEQVFARQVEALARPCDMLVAISTSGNSANVIAAAKAARTAGCTVVAMTGRGGGSLAGHADLLLAAPSDVVSRIQEVHGLCIHVLAQGVEDALLDRGEETP